jgi:hypothetical protein
METINEKFNNKFLELDEKLKKQEDDLNEKHAKEMEDLFNNMEDKLRTSLKHSKQFFELKKQEEGLVKRQKY